MRDESGVSSLTDAEALPQEKRPKGTSQRTFIKQMGAAAGVVAAAVASPSIVSAQEFSSSSAPASPVGPQIPPGITHARVKASYDLRVSEATRTPALGPRLTSTTATRHSTRTRAARTPRVFRTTASGG